MTSLCVFSNWLHLALPAVYLICLMEKMRAALRACRGSLSAIFVDKSPSVICWVPVTTFYCIPSLHLATYRKHYSCETVLLALTENWKMALDNHKVVGVLSKDMSKAFDSLYHPLILTKLKAYGVEDNSLCLMRSYFMDLHNRFKLGFVMSDWHKVQRGCLKNLHLDHWYRISIEMILLSMLF